MRHPGSTLILALLVITLATSTEATAASPATTKTSACPEGIQKQPATCPRAIVNAKSSICPAQKTTCTAKRTSCEGLPPKVVVTTKKGWQLAVHILQPGTRSQGYHGELYNNGKRMEGTRGEILETPLGKMRWKGGMKERAHPWETTGWISDDNELFQEKTNPHALKKN